MWYKDDLRVHPYIVLNLREEPATLITSLLIPDATAKEVFDRLSNTYQRLNMQSQLNLWSQLHSLQLSQDRNVQLHLTRLEEIIVELARINDPENKSEKCGIFLCSLPQSLSYIAAVVQANNMNLIDLCALLRSENECRKTGKQILATPLLPYPTAHFFNSVPRKRRSSTPDRKSFGAGTVGKEVTFKVNVGFVSATIATIFSRIQIATKAYVVTIL